jgi:hypothetical protein
MAKGMNWEARNKREHAVSGQEGGIATAGSRLAVVRLREQSRRGKAELRLVYEQWKQSQETR